jgi:resuscitation-promoting factor RpfB
MKQGSLIFAGKSMKRPILLLLTAILFISGCAAPRVSSSDVQIRVTVNVDGQSLGVDIPSGSSIQQAIEAANVTLGSLDRVEPPVYALAQDGSQVSVIRVREEFDTREVTLPFERQTVRNESLPQGEKRLIQEGRNGAQEITTRRLFENGIETGATIVKAVILQAAQPEIVMVGMQTAFASLPVEGKLVYLSGGNAWIMEGSTANRAPAVTSGDLDGRVLQLSPRGDFLLYTRKSEKPLSEEINTLWVLRLGDQNAKPISLKTANIVHFADWIPGAGTQIAYSTVEPRAAAPGWQANNDLYLLKFNANGRVERPELVIQPNSGGVYGWWGSDYAWAPDGSRLAYARPDGIGLVNFRDKSLVSLLELTPLQTLGDWALIPPLNWGADSRTLYYVHHAPPPGLVNPEESPYFDLGVLSLESSANVRIVRQTGMFAYPSASPAEEKGDEQAFRIAHLYALSPLQSETSGYRLAIMDRDGSNRRTLFPLEGAPGLEPQQPHWSPDGKFLTVVYQGNLWLIDVNTGTATQITGDGLIDKIDWR